jgi:hypothetical protein
MSGWADPCAKTRSHPVSTASAANASDFSGRSRRVIVRSRNFTLRYLRKRRIDARFQIDAIDNLTSLSLNRKIA